MKQFNNTKWDVRNWTKEQKEYFQLTMFRLGHTWEFQLPNKVLHLNADCYYITDGLLTRGIGSLSQHCGRIHQVWEDFLNHKDSHNKHKWHDEIVAWAEGKPIQYNYLNDSNKDVWMLCDTPQWDANNLVFRVKPDEPKKYWIVLAGIKVLTDNNSLFHCTETELCSMYQHYPDVQFVEVTLND